MKGQSALAICVQFGNNEAMRVLLKAKADPNEPACTNGSRPLSHSGMRDNVEGARLLVEARADASAKDSFGANAFQWAASFAGTEVAKELYNIPGAATSLEELLHCAILVGQGSPNHIEMLLSLGCDINEQSCLRLAPPAVHLLLRILGVKHSRGYTKKTPFNTFAYHYRGATPLMFGIILGKYSIAGFLLEAKARIDICNSRKQTAFDLAVKQSAPDALLWNLWKRGAGSYASQASVSWWCAHTVSLTVQPKGEGILEDDMDDMDDLDPLDPMISIIFWFLPADFKELQIWGFGDGRLQLFFISRLAKTQRPFKGMQRSSQRPWKSWVNSSSLVQTPFWWRIKLSDWEHFYPFEHCKSPDWLIQKLILLTFWDMIQPQI